MANRQYDIRKNTVKMAFILESVQNVEGGGNLGQTERLLRIRFKEYHHINNKIIIQSSLKIS